MIGSLIGLLFLLVFLGVCWWAARRILALIPLEEPFATLVYVVLVVIGVLIVLYVAAAILGIGGIHVNRLGF